MPKQSRLSKLFLFLAFALLYAPIIYLIVYSFNEGGNMSEFTGFTLDHYRALIEDKRMLSFLMNTFIVALASALIATIIGTVGAITIYSIQSKRRAQLALTLNNILMVTPDVMMGASFLILFSSFLPIRLGFWSVLVAHVAFSVPIVVLMVLPRLYEMNANMITAAMDLGANGRQILTRVILPSISPGIMAGFLMAFTYSLDDFAVTFFVTGNGFSTLAVEVYSRARRGISLEINALSSLMFLVALALVIVYYGLQKREDRRAKQAEMALPDYELGSRSQTQDATVMFPETIHQIGEED